ncbi:MAG: DUF5908 family protein [Roseiarcus sp.]|jgi:hypothetical protein
MPVEIREINIGAEVVDEPKPAPAQAADTEALRAEILADCAELIRKALDRLGER